MEASNHQQKHYQAPTKLSKTSLVCLSALLLPCCSLLLPAFHSLVQLLCINMNKNYMFLLFNGILVILKISRGVGDSPEGGDLHGVSNARYREVGTKAKALHEPSSSLEVTNKEVVNLEEKEANEESSFLVLVEEESTSSGILVTEEVEGDQQENGGDGNENFGEDEEDEIGLMEWNRKFDDFIRKMREGIKTEAGQS